jgi:hypothetical protein
MLLDSCLTAEEKAKFDRLESRLAGLFIEAGCAVRICEGAGDGASRMINFGMFGQPLISIPATQFLSETDEQVLATVKRKLITK